MAKVRVYKLAEELELDAGELISILRKEGVEVKSHMSGIDPEIADIIREQLTSATEPSEVASPDADDATPSEPAPVSDADKAEPVAAQKDIVSSPPPSLASANSKELHLKPPIIVKDLAEALVIKPNTLIHELLKMNIFASINQTLDSSTAEQVCENFGFHLITEKREKQTATESTSLGPAPEDVVYDDEEVVERPPVVAFLGHVDHGKTSLLDRIRNTKVTAKEAGGITQHIGATTIEKNGHWITFIDTPGHEAFTAMRARGAGTTDIVVLVVAADDGVMPQTIEAINHARAAEVPIVVAVNKCDLEGIDPLKVLTQLQQNELTPEEWGGDIGVVQVSAETGDGIDDLLERLILEAELLELKANPKLPVKAIVIESQLEQGLGATVNVLVKNGSVRVGDTVLCGQFYGKVKALYDDQGERIKELLPSQAAKLVGLSGVPDCGAILVGVTDEKQVKKLVDQREHLLRTEHLKPTRQANLEDLFRQIEEDARNDLKVIVKTDVQGTGEAVVDMLTKIESLKIRIEFVHIGVGAITENDVLLAAASDAIVVGFHVRVNAGVNTLAKKEGVDIRLYSVIYELAEQMKESMIGMLAPEKREVALGQSEILEIFEMSKGGKICGCSVSKGVVKVGAKARVHRGGELIYDGTIASLRRFQDDVKEVRQGFECGIRLDHFNDFEVGDVIDVYDYKEIAATL